MTPVEPNPDVVIRRLRMMRDALDTLDGFRGVDVAQLNDDPVARAAVELVDISRPQELYKLGIELLCGDLEDFC